MLEDSDLNKIAELVKKHKSLNRWYNDPEKAKRYGPWADSLCWIFGGLTIISLILLAVQASNFNSTDSNLEFVNMALSTMDCDSLRGISYALLKDGDSMDQFKTINYLLNTQILTRCT